MRAPAGQAIGSDMPTGFLSSAGAGAGGAASTSGRVGSGEIATRPRASWRIACAAGSSGSSIASGSAGVGLLAQRHRERHLAEHRHVELVGQLLAAALAEDLEALAARGREAGHVLDHAGDLE